MKSYIVYVDGEEVGVIKAASHNAAEKKAQKKYPGRQVMVAYTEFASNPVTLRVRKGTRVQFKPTPASHVLYSSPPPVGAKGHVTTTHFGGGIERTSLPGPGGGLVYVQWDDGSFQGVSPLDLVELPDQHGYGARVCAGPGCTKRVTGKSDYCRGCAPSFVQVKRLEENPSDGGAMLALAALAAAGVAWLIFRSKPATAAPAASPPALPAPPPPAAACPLDTQKLFNWGNEVGIQAVHLFGMNIPPDFAELKKSFPNMQEAAIVITKDGAFWRYVQGSPTPAPEMRTQYCSWAAKAAALANPPAAEPPPPTSPPPPPPPAPTSAPQSAALQGTTGITIYLLKRLFVWTGSTWKLEDNFDAYLPPTESYSGAAYMSFKASPTFPQTATASPPYYFADVWEWSSGTWKKIHCAVNYTVPGCQREG